VDNSAPGNDAWSAELVREELRRAYPLAQASGTWERVRALTDVLDPEGRRLLATWASLTTSGGSIRELCRARGTDQRTFYRRLHATLQAAADALNAAGVPSSDARR